MPRSLARRQALALLFAFNAFSVAALAASPSSASPAAASPSAATRCEDRYAARDFAGAAATNEPGLDTSHALCVGRALVRTGRPGDAIPHVTRALRESETLEDRFSAANGLGMAHSHQGNGDEAIAAHGRALDLARALRDPSREADTLLNLAIAYEESSELLAVGLLERSLVLSPDSTVALLTLGAIHQEQRRWDRARPLAERAVRLSRQGNDKGRLLTALLQLADTERHVGRDEQALRAGREALDLAIARRDRSSEALAYEILTEVYIDRDDAHEAMVHAFAAMATRFGNGDDEAVDRIAVRMKQAFEQPRQ